MLIDEATIHVQGGRGGDGHVSFRREKYVPNGGPDGGDGGRGGDVLVRAEAGPHGLDLFRRKHDFAAPEGEQGGRQQKSGKRGEDLVLAVPVGTVVRELLPDGRKQQLADLQTVGQTVRVARGGNGGWGNQHFATSIKQAPDWAKPGQPGEQRKLELEWQLIADVGLIGLPNAGKSTLLSVISRAKPKIAAYPFTTLEPELGVVEIDDKTFVVADIPGLIAGASEGKGLGDAFLKHVRRTGLLIHLISVENEDMAEAYRTIRQELAAFDQALADRPEIAVVTKSELVAPVELVEKTAAIAQTAGQPPAVISAATHAGIPELVRQIVSHL